MSYQKNHERLYDALLASIQRNNVPKTAFTLEVPKDNELGHIIRWEMPNESRYGLTLIPDIGCTECWEKCVAKIELFVGNFKRQLEGK